MSGSDDIADAGQQAFDEEHRLVDRPGERPDWEAREQAQAGAADALGTGDEDTVAPGTQSPANEPIGSDLGGPDAYGRGPSDTDRTGGNWADVDDAGASATGVPVDPTTPGAPADPTAPGAPVAPGAPEVPGAPEPPVIPTDPTVPVSPDDPAAPEPAGPGG